MQITVKEAKVVKTGTNKSGDWELIRVASEDNTEYTTFDKKAKHLTKGSVIDFEPIIKEGKCSFKEFEVISEAPSNVPLPQMSKEDWSDKQRVERASIESQVAYKGLIELMIAKVAPTSVGQAAISWALSKLGKVPPVSTTAPESDKQPDVPGVEGNSIDLAWLRESLKTLKWTSIVGYLKNQYGLTAGETVTECLGYMTREQQEDFTIEIQNRLEML